MTKLLVSEFAYLICNSGASTRIWSECRPKGEIEQFANTMDDRLKLIEEKEQEQGMSLMGSSQRPSCILDPGLTPFVHHRAGSSKSGCLCRVYSNRPRCSEEFLTMATLGTEGNKIVASIEV